MNTNPTAVLLISCPDQKGLVARIAQFIYENDGNIVHSDHHTDLESGLFLMRVEWELNGFRIGREQIAAVFSRLATALRMTWELHFSDQPQRLALMVSRQSHCLYDLLWRHSAGELPAELALVISNHPDLAPVVERFGIPYVHVPVTAENKLQQEHHELELLAKHKVDSIVLARYMQVLTSQVVDRYPRRIINIHHSFLPAFVGSRPYHQAHERGVKLIGATSHYVTSELDEGPIIEQDVVRISHRDTVDDLIRKGRDLERVVLARAVRFHLEHRILPYGRKTVVFD
jgi:formyltetrahydrofolate deformylase